MQAAAASDSITARCHAAAGGRRGPHGDAARLKGCQVPPRRGHAVGMGPLRVPPAASSAPTAPRGNGGSVGLLPPRARPPSHRAAPRPIDVPTVLPHALWLSPRSHPGLHLLLSQEHPSALSPLDAPLRPLWGSPMFSMGVDALPEGVPCPRTGKFGVCGEISGCVWCSHALGSAPLWGTQCWGVGGPSPSPCIAGCHRPHCAIGVWLMDFGVWSMNSVVRSVGFRIWLMDIGVRPMDGLWGLADGFWGLVHELWGPVRGRWVLTDGLFGVWPMVWRWGRADWLVGAPKPWVWSHCRARGTGGLWAGVPPPPTPHTCRMSPARCSLGNGDGIPTPRTHPSPLPG